MKPVSIVFGFFLVAAAIYIGSPFATAWGIREAVRNGDSEYLASAIEWPTVRETLKPSIARIALNLPDPNADPAASNGLWTRFKAYWGQSAVDSVVETYVTPEGLPQLFTLRGKYRDLVGSDADEAKTMPILDRIQRAWARVKRAEFTSPTSFEIDMEDKYDPTRIYLGKLELRSVGWKLTELRVKFLTTAKNAVQKFTDTNM
ncbi:DUF2939 domain-containing protein [Hyphomicrobium sp.]|uniref:DUF2939 domain-containing protein n=1 Tax=Hyphomicrobium sp. TaxID=82 RepID=UPI001DB47ABE|nr:DUF2939 domain-containing protein [Hyphomicrobium sp.]MBY0559942.1 DUF2939 domain-containing protein [Hyphomicrobium sp.]